MTLSLQARLEVARDVQARQFDDELVVLDLTRGEYFALDDVGARVWEGVVAGRSLAEVVVALGAEYAADDARLEADVIAFAEELVGRRLLVERG